MVKIFITFFVALVLSSCSRTDNELSSAKPEQHFSQSRLLFADSMVSSFELLYDTITDGFKKRTIIKKIHNWNFIRYLEYYENDGLVVWEGIMSEYSIQKSSDVFPSSTDEGMIYLDAYLPMITPISDTTHLKTPKWRDTLNANEVYYRNLYFESIKYNDVSPIRTIYNYSDGKPYMTFTSDLYGLEMPIPVEGRRFIAYNDLTLSNNHPDYGEFIYLDPLTLKKQVLSIEPTTDFLGNSHMYSEEKLISIGFRNLMKRQGERYDLHKDSIALKQHWGYSDFKNIDIILYFDGPVRTSIVVPIRNDVIDTNSIRSKWFSVKIKRDS